MQPTANCALIVLAGLSDKLKQLCIKQQLCFFAFFCLPIREINSPLFPAAFFAESCTFVKILTMGIADKLFQLKNDKAAENLKAGQDFLAANKTKPGITELPSGLQYEVITEGNGSKPLATNSVTCHYHGTLIDGTVFDSSVKRGQPATFPLNRVITGWTEGLQLMPTGSKWRFFIPPHLGYGDRQVSAQIGPNSTLVFEVELISFT